MLEKYFETKDLFGHLTLYRDVEKGLFLVEPRGIINPNLIKIDLKEAALFGEKQKRKWVYLVNTKYVTLPNPLNLFFLKRIKKLPYLEKYVIYAPSIVVRLLGFFTIFIIKPDKVLKTEKELQFFIE